MRRQWTILCVVAVVWMWWLGVFGFVLADEQPQPAITMQEAAHIVQTRFPNARMLEIELDTEDGRLLYEVKLVTARGQKKEVRVNATDGQIGKVEND